VDEHGAGIYELFDLEVLQRAQKTAGALDVDTLVERFVLAREVEECGEVDDAGDARAMLFPKLFESAADRVIAAEIDMD
jgi:hypothetical protein